MEIGRVVFSKAGKDKSRAFIVVSFEGEYVFLADGSSRPIKKPKKKKTKHIQPTNVYIEEIRNKLENNLHINDADIRKALLPYSRNEGV